MKVRVEHESGKTETTFVSAGLMRLCDIEEVEGVADRVLYAVWYDWRHRRGWTDEDDWETFAFEVSVSPEPDEDPKVQ